MFAFFYFVSDSQIKLFFQWLLSKLYIIFSMPSALSLLKLFITWHFRSSHWKCSIKKVLLKNLQNSQRNICARESLLIKLQNTETFRRLLPTFVKSLWENKLAKLFWIPCSCEKSIVIDWENFLSLNLYVIRMFLSTIFVLLHLDSRAVLF